jgi:hypothetical protein
MAVRSEGFVDVPMTCMTSGVKQLSVSPDQQMSPWSVYCVQAAPVSKRNRNATSNPLGLTSKHSFMRRKLLRPAKSVLYDAHITCLKFDRHGSHD